MSIHATVFTTSQIGPKQELTPEGFLLCKDVAVARTGLMIYGPNETPIAAGVDGIVRIYRLDEDVFSPSTIASALGKPITNEHPEEDVTPETWKKEAHGMALNVRRGEGAYDDLLLMDLLITTTEGIEAVQKGKREISLGYDADYEETGPGEGKQSNIIINHIALVEQGRCGSRCAIKDSKLKLEAKSMRNTISKKVMDLLFRAHKAKDTDELSKLANEVLDEGAFLAEEHTAGLHEGEGNLHAYTTADQFAEHVSKNEQEHGEMFARIAALEEALKAKTIDDALEAEKAADAMEAQKAADLDAFLEQEAPAGVSKDMACSAKDSIYLGESFKDTVAQAEILAPGLKIPTYDSALAPAKTAKTICKLRRSAVDQAFASPENSDIVQILIGDKPVDIKSMTCDAIRTLFKSAAALKAAANNNKGTRDSLADVKPAAHKMPTLEDIAAANKAFYSNQK